MKRNHPNNDPDLNLARSLNNWIGQGKGTNIPKDDDPLKNILLTFRREEYENRKKIGSPSDGNWRKIQQAIGEDLHQSRSGKATVYTLKLWLSAAAIVLIAFTGIFLFFNSRNAHLLLKTGNVRKEYITADGSSITLRPHSAIYLVNKSKSKQTYRLNGEALFDVHHNPARYFVVISGNGEVTVLGTRFDMSDWGDRVQVYLERGSVAFKDLKTSERVVLRPGEASSIEPNGQLKKPAARNSNQYLDWLTNRLTFDHQTIENVFDELDQQFQINIVVDSKDSAILNQTVSGKIQLTGLQQTLNNISLVIGGKFIKEQNRRYRFLPNSR